MKIKNLRIILQIISLTLITLLLLGIGADCFGWMAKIQLIPSVLRVVGSATLLNIAVIAGILLITWLFGRIYCSVVCPLGILQDLISWLRRQGGLWILKIQGKIYRNKQSHPKLKPLVKHFKYSKERKAVRLIIIGAYIGSLVAGIQIAISFLAPYATYSRLISALLGEAKPAVAAVSFAIIFACSWFGGRWWCNTVCPVGTFLGTISRHSLVKPAFDTEKCNDCGRCERSCKSSCIDVATHSIDTSRCVDCFDCVSRCKEGAISFRITKTEKGHNDGRRKFLSVSAIALAGGAAAQAKEKLKPLGTKQAPERTTPLLPPGAKSARHFHDTCIACGLCVTACPNKVLIPSTRLESFMQPEMNFEKGFCRPECTACSQVCPTGAIAPVSREQKTTIKIGTAHIDRGLCIAATGHDSCGNCASKCPSGAIRMVEMEGRLQPVVVEEECIGCGKCEYLCPVRPISAITVEGIKVHRNGQA